MASEKPWAKPLSRTIFVLGLEADWGRRRWRRWGRGCRGENYATMPVNDEPMTGTFIVPGYSRSPFGFGRREHTHHSAHEADLRAVQVQASDSRSAGRRQADLKQPIR